MLGPKFLYALFTPRDRLHSVSRAFMTFLREGDLPFRRLVVNEHIVDGTATRLEEKAALKNAAAFLSTLDESHRYRFESVSEEAFATATERFVEWTDRGGSLTASGQ